MPSPPNEQVGLPTLRRYRWDERFRRDALIFAFLVGLIMIAIPATRKLALLLSLVLPAAYGMYVLLERLGPAGKWIRTVIIFGSTIYQIDRFFSMHR